MRLKHLQEIHALASTTNKLSLKLIFVESTITNSHALLLDDVVRCGLVQLTSEAETLVAEIEALQLNLGMCGYITQKTRWAIKDARTAARILSKMKDVEDGLSKWTSFLSLKGHSLTMQQLDNTQRILGLGFAEMKDMIATVAIGDSDTLLNSSSGPPPQYRHINPRGAQRTSTGAISRRNFESNLWESSRPWQYLGLHRNIIKSTQGEATDHDLGFRINLPLAWLFGTYALTGQLGIRTSPRQNTLTLRHPSYLAVARVLDKTHPFLLAFVRNDLGAIRHMLHTGEGRPTDTDCDGQGLLFYAIAYCGVDVLGELLDTGIDIDGITVPDELMTALETAVRWQRTDAVRVLLQRGASADHVGPRGLNALFYSFYPIKGTWRNGSSMDRVHVLNEYVWMDPGATWDYGGTALHAAAMFSSGEDIDALAKLGCDLEHVDKQESTALRYAVKYGNSSAYFALLRNGANMGGDSNNCAGDLLMNAIMCKGFARGRTSDLVEYDHDTIVKDLLRHHLPPRSLLYIHANGSWPASITDRMITWQEFAAIYGPEIEAWFADLLQECWYPNERQDSFRPHELISNESTRQGRITGEASQAEHHGEDDFVDESRASNHEPDENSAGPRNSAGDDGESFWDAAEVL